MKQVHCNAVCLNICPCRSYFALNDRDHGISDDWQHRRAQFLLEWKNPLKCEKCGTRFKWKRKFKEHEKEFHAY